MKMMGWEGMKGLHNDKRRGGGRVMGWVYGQNRRFRNRRSQNRRLQKGRWLKGPYFMEIN